MIDTTGSILLLVVLVFVHWLGICNLLQQVDEWREKVMLGKGILQWQDGRNHSLGTRGKSRRACICSYSIWYRQKHQNHNLSS